MSLYNNKRYTLAELVEARIKAHLKGDMRHAAELDRAGMQPENRGYFELLKKTAAERGL